MSCYCDYDPPAFVSSAIRKARTQHKCCECGHKILPGENYEHVVGKWDGSLATFDTCENCADLRDSLADQNGCFAYGGLSEDYWGFLETLLPEGADSKHAEIFAKHRNGVQA